MFVRQVPLRALSEAILALYEGGLLMARTSHSTVPMSAAAGAAQRLIETTTT